MCGQRQAVAGQAQAHDQMILQGSCQAHPARVLTCGILAATTFLTPVSSSGCSGAEKHLI